MSEQNAVKERPILFSGEMVRAILDGRKTQTRRVVVPQPDVRPADFMRFYPNATAKNRKHYGTEEHMRRGLPLDFCPYGQAGDRLWVRETFDIRYYANPEFTQQVKVLYAADHSTLIRRATKDVKISPHGQYRWRPSIFMPRIFSRIDLEIVKTQVQKLQDITAEDALAEGVKRTALGSHEIYVGNDIQSKIDPSLTFREKRTVLGSYEIRVGDDVHRTADARETFRLLWDAINAKRGYGWDVDPWVWVVEFRRL